MTLQEIRQEANDLMKMVDEFVIMTTKDLNEKEAVISHKMKQYALLDEREKNISLQEQGIAKERALLKREQDALSEKLHLLELKEQELNKKIQRVSDLMK